MKNILNKFRSFDLYNYKSTPGKSVFVFVHLIILCIFLLVLLTSAKSNEKTVVIERGGKQIVLSKDASCSVNVLKAQIYNHAVYLTWLTSSEHTQGYYIIERFKTSDSSQYVGIIPSKGGSKNVLYSFEDKNAPEWKCFYKVWFVGNDNTYFESEFIVPEVTEEVTAIEN